MNKWDQRFLELAKLVASWSKDPSTKVGAVVVDEHNRILSVGFNGFAQGVDDSEERLNDRNLKYAMIIHAEVNALAFASGPTRNSTVYLWPFLSCSSCAAQIIQHGVKRVVAPVNDNPRWADSFVLSQMQFREAGVQVDLVDFPAS